MNRYEPESNGAVVTAEPLFASVWLALYYQLRKKYIARRAMKSTGPDSLHGQSSDPRERKNDGDRKVKT